MRFFLLVVLALLAAPATPAAAQTSAADSAWAAGETELATRLYEARLETDPDDGAALHRLALARAWDEQYDESLALFDRLLTLAPENLEARVDRARVLAWQGDHRRAIEELDALLARYPDHLPALAARAQFLSWAGEIEASVAAYDQLLELSPDARQTRFDRARVLAWGADFTAAIEAYDRLLAEDPEDVEALLGRATVLGWSGAFGEAEEVYHRILEIEPANLEARRGLARLASWDGDLVEAERRWRAIIATHPADVPALTGLGQTLRWQGRDAAAAEVLREAGRLAPQDSDVIEQRRWAELALSPGATPAVVHESDSDGNRITTSTLGGSVRVTPRLEIRGTGYLREARTAPDAGPGPDRRAWGGTLTAWRQFEPGWNISLSLGGSASNDANATLSPSFGASLESPGRYPLVAILAYERAAADQTAALIENRVTVEETRVTLRASPGAWRASAGAGVARFFTGNVGDSNRRISGHASLRRQIGPSITIGPNLRAFGFRRQLTLGYFDPDLYYLAELVGGWTTSRRSWTLHAEVAPGIQQVGGDGETTTSFRGTGRLGYTVAPGREVGLSLAFANSGFDRLLTGSGEGYRYRAVSLSAAWRF